MKRTPQCYGCRTRAARKGSRFCTQRCAADYAEELVEGNDDTWCPACADWVSIAMDGSLTCEHEVTP